MSELNDYRNTLTSIDEKMASLFEERLKLCKEISGFKTAKGLSVRDIPAEADKIAMHTDMIKDDEIRSYYMRFLKGVMDISCSYQEMLMGGMNVAYGGVEGAYAYIAASKMFPTSNLISQTDFIEAYESVERGDCDVAVLPIENSIAGEVGAVMDLMYKGSLYINQVYDLPIKHRLMGIPGSKKSEIKTVISHTQALDQCASYIRKKGYETEAAANTSAAAKKILALNDKTVGAIASEETASIFGLEILDNEIQNSGINTTRFAVFSRSLNTTVSESKRDKGCFILVFTVKHEAGALALTLNILASHGYNMRNLKSRPARDIPWNYYFYLEAEGDINNKNGEEMMRELSVICGSVKIVGSYSA